MARRKREMGKKIQTMLKKARKLVENGKHRKAEEILNQCAKMVRRTRDELLQAQVQFEIANYFAEKEDWLRAEEAGSMALRLAKNAPLKARADIIFLLAEVRSGAGLYDLALSDSKDAESMYAQIHDTSRQACCLIRQADILSEQRQFDEALNAANAAVNLTSKNDAIGILATRTLAKVLYKSGDLVHAESEAREALRQSEKLGNKLVLKETLVILGSILKDIASLRNSDSLIEAEKHYKRALQLSRKLHEQLSEAQILMNIGAINDDLGRLEKARENYLDALTLLKKVGNPHKIAMVQLNLGSLFGRKGQPRKTIELSNKALEVFEQTGDILRQAFCLHNIGLAQIALGELHEALSTFKDCLEKFETYRAHISSPALRKEFRSSYCSVFEDLCYLCIKTGNMAKALNYLELSKFSEVTERLMLQPDNQDNIGVSTAEARQSKLVAEYSKQYRRLRQGIDIDVKLKRISESKTGESTAYLFITILIERDSEIRLADNIGGDQNWKRLTNKSL